MNGVVAESMCQKTIKSSVRSKQLAYDSLSEIGSVSTMIYWLTVEQNSKKTNLMTGKDM